MRIQVKLRTSLSRKQAIEQCQEIGCTICAPFANKNVSHETIARQNNNS